MLTYIADRVVPKKLKFADYSSDETKYCECDDERQLYMIDHPDAVYREIVKEIKKDGPYKKMDESSQLAHDTIIAGLALHLARGWEYGLTPKFATKYKMVDTGKFPIRLAKTYPEGLKKIALAATKRSMARIKQKKRKKEQSCEGYNPKLEHNKMHDEFQIRCHIEAYKDQIELFSS